MPTVATSDLVFPKYFPATTWCAKRLISRRALYAFASGLVCVGILWQVENWRGQKRWDTLAEGLIQQGVVLDWRAHLSESGPEEDNVAAHPFFDGVDRQVLLTDDGKPLGYYPDIESAFPPFFEGIPKSLLNGKLGSLSHWAETLGHKEAGADSEAAARVVLQATAHVDPLVLGLYEALQRPNCHWVDIDPQQAAGPIVPQISNLTDTVQKLVSLLSTRAVAHLELGDSEAATRELLTVVQFGKILPSDSTLVTALVSTAISKLISTHLAELLTHPGWKDRDLARIGEVIETFSILGELQQGFDMEYASVMFYCHQFMEGRADWFESSSSNSRDRLIGAMVEYMPRGWHYQNMVTITDWWQSNFMGFYDPSTRRLIRQAPSDLDTLFKNPLTPFNFLAKICCPQISNFTQSAAIAQTDWDLLRVLCAAQRFRLAHRGYPNKLEALVPDYIEVLPKDYVTGATPSYSLEGDGFSLASLDWERSGERASFLCELSVP